MKPAIFLLLPLAACAHTPVPVKRLPLENVITDKELVLMPCSEVVTKIGTDMDGATVDQPFEEKAYRVTRSDAQRAVYVTRLEEAATRCGVKILRK